jgi:hypothetical protein
MSIASLLYFKRIYLSGDVVMICVFAAHFVANPAQPTIFELLQNHKAAALIQHYKGWPAPYICTVYDRIFGDFPAKSTVYSSYIYIGLARTVFTHRK